MVDFKTKIFVAVDVIFRNGFVFLQKSKGVRLITEVSIPYFACYSLFFIHSY